MKVNRNKECLPVTEVTKSEALAMENWCTDIAIHDKADLEFPLFLEWLEANDIPTEQPHHPDLVRIAVVEFLLAVTEHFAVENASLHYELDHKGVPTWPDTIDD